MEEIGTKKDTNIAKQNTTDSNNAVPHYRSGYQGESSDTKQITERGDGDKKEDAEATVV